LDEQDALKRAFTAAGNATRLAERLGISIQAVMQWKRVPATRVLEVERIVDGAVTRYEMRPDIYPPEERRAAS
jgi:DNA-binding transcriptional regulator YdaS (Cro superfamily)